MKKVVIFISISLTLGIAFILYKSIFNPFQGPITFLDYPYTLEDQEDTLDLTYIQWACACANWIPTSNFEVPSYANTDYSKDCIFIESGHADLLVNEEPVKGYSSKRIRVVGSFYKNEGISRDYENPLIKNQKLPGFLDIPK